MVQLSTDYFLKPCITTLFNAVVQPPLIFVYNVCASFRDICHPLAEGMGYFLREIVSVVKAFRIVDVKRERISDKDKLEEKNEVVA